MDHFLFTAVSGANRSLAQQKIHANNLSNVNTQGFRADLERSITTRVAGKGYATRFPIALENAGVDMTAGVLKETGLDLDIALKDRGLIALQDGNREVYTRDGHINIGANGELTVHQLPLLGDGGAIVLPPHSSLSIARDGTISIVPQDGIAIPADIDRIKLVDIPANQLRKNDRGLLITDLPTHPRDEGILIENRYLEGSNISAVSEMLSSISIGRYFEVQINMIKIAKELAQAGNKLLQG